MQLGAIEPVQPVAHVGPVAPVGQGALVGALQPVVLVQTVQPLQPVQELGDLQLLRRGLFYGIRRRDPVMKSVNAVAALCSNPRSDGYVPSQS
eukprot:gene13380-biopygen6543